MDDHYEYKAVNTADREIRLLVIHAGSGTSNTIHCSFQHLLLKEGSYVPPYKTISYTWGDPTPTSQLIVSGKPLMVPKSAEQATRKFRLTDNDQVLWIDAACINQNDIEERNAHVRYMSLVYSKSQGNLVYLGEDEEDLSGLAFATLRRLNEKKLAMTRSISPDSKELKALDSVFSRPWFRRAWVVQEVVLGGTSLCHLGQHTILLHQFIFAALAVRRAAEWQDTHAEVTEKFSAETAIAIENLVTVSGLRDQYKKGIPEVPDIAELIPRSRQCSNPRDMVYCIIGLLDPPATRDMPPRLRIRYEDTVQNVYRSATRYSLAHRDSPYILHQVVHRTDGEIYDNDGFPTWVPQWHRQLETGTPSRLSIKFHCWPHNELIKPKDKCEDLLPNLLRLDGIVIDTVTSVTDVLRLDDCHDPVAVNNFVTTAEHIARQVTSESSSKLDFTTSLAKTLIAGSFNFFKLCTQDDIDHFSRYRQHLSRLVQENATRLIRNIPPGDGSRRYHNQLTTVCVWRRFMATKHGHIGLAPQATRAGDAVVALRNGMWPFVLRRVDCEEERWQLLGQAYLRGYMQGEIVEECRKGERKVVQFTIV
jgi:hypothetical protein